jgi:hypothetical protein
MKTHLEVAHEYGVNQALKQAGYTSVAEVEKEAAALGLLNKAATPAPKTAADRTGALAFLKNKLG